MLDRRADRVERERATEVATVTGARGTPVAACLHLADAHDQPRPEHPVCEECHAAGLSDWVHLRQCLTCGHVGCCDSSPRRHATAHFTATEHPVIRSAEPGEDWRWCYVDERTG